MNCFHCDLPVAENTQFVAEIHNEARQFCCPGCLAVAQHLTGMGLDQYYALRLAPALRPDQDPIVDVSDDIESQFTRDIADGRRQIELAVEGITCGGCAWLIEHALERMNGVVVAVVNLAQHRVQIQYDPRQLSSSHLITELHQVGYRSSPWRPSQAARLQRAQRRKDMTRLIVSGLGSMQAMMFAVALYTADASYIEYRHEQLLRWISLLVSVPVMVYAARPFYSGALNALRHRRLNMDVPVSTALTIAWITSIWHVFAGQGEVYFDSVSMFVFFLLTGRYFERSMMAQGLAASGLDRMPLPSLVTRLEQGEAHRVMADTLAVGDHILLNGGEYLSVDGTVTEGRGEVSQSHLTGESEPIAVVEGDTLLAGALNGPTPLTLRVVAVGEQRTLSQLESNATIAQANRPKTLSWAQAWTGRFVAFQLTAAICSGLIWFQIDPSRVIDIVVAVLVATCPCAFALAAPTAMGAAVSGARKCGAALLSPNALERLASVRQTLTDKTGTLTLGRPKIIDVQWVSDIDAELAHGIAAGLEAGVSHPLARPFHGLACADVTDIQVIQGAA